jgi:hypothetical protein
MRAFVVVVVLAGVLLVGCSDDGEANGQRRGTGESVASTTTTTSASGAKSSTTARSGLADCANRPAGSSTATFDPSAGTYAVQDVSLARGPLTLTFNVVQWLSGQDAERAWEHDHPEDPNGPPNDYYIVDASDRLRAAPLKAGATVLLTHLSTDATPPVEPDTIGGLEAYLGEGPPTATYWLSFDGGVVTEVCEQYFP